MKKFLLLAILAASVLSVRAEFNKLVFRTLDGEEQSVDLTGLNITFTDGQLLAVSQEASVTISVASLASMEFADGDIDGIQAAEADATVTAYSTDGICYGAFESKSAASEALPVGLYIIKSASGLTSKLLIKR